MTRLNVLVVGCGNAALCAAISALENGAAVTILEASDIEEMGGNSRYTAGAMRFVYNHAAELKMLLGNKNDPRIPISDFGKYTKTNFEEDFLKFNEKGRINIFQKIIIEESYHTITWMKNHHVMFEPIYARQSFIEEEKYIFWGGLTLAAQGEGVGLVDALRICAIKMGVKICYNAEAVSLIADKSGVLGLKVKQEGRLVDKLADSVILACGGFEANRELREKYMGSKWGDCKVRGSRFNQGAGLNMALDIGAAFYGNPKGCHATPMDYYMPEYGNTEIPHIERKKYRKICYFLGIMINKLGLRFVDEGKDFRNLTYAQYGATILDQPDQIAWQIFDKKVLNLLYDEYRFSEAHFVEAMTMDGLIEKIVNINKAQFIQTITEYNSSVNHDIQFNPAVLDGKSTTGLDLNKTNWANSIDTPPFRAYPVTCGITFTYGGLKINDQAMVLDVNDNPIANLYACGEIVGGIFENGYPGGTGLTSGAVFGKLAGRSSAQEKNLER